MRLIISQDGVKLELSGAFGLCATPDDLGVLIRELQAAKAGMDGCGTAYGWVRIDPSHPCDAAPNTPPKKWRD